MQTSRYSAALAVALALATASCDSDDDATTAADGNTADTPAQTGSPEDQIRGTQDAFVDNVRNKNYQQACNLLTPQMRATVAPGDSDCPTSYRKLFADFPLQAGRQVKITKVKINGNKATATAKSKDGFINTTIEFTNQNNTWHISGPLPEQ
jgi:hypothetical protein